jgi:chaperonin GroES
LSRSWNRKIRPVVVFAKYAGTEVKLDGEEYLVLRASDLIGILPEG